MVVITILYHGHSLNPGLLPRFSAWLGGQWPDFHAALLWLSKGKHLSSHLRPFSKTKWFYEKACAKL